MMGEELCQSSLRHIDKDKNWPHSRLGPRARPAKAIDETPLYLQQNAKIAWTLAAGLMLAALLWPALWNGFPIVFYDTGGYLARPFEGTLSMGRSALYGAFLATGVRHHFWPNIIVQA